MKLSHVPLRLATGAFILNSGLNKRKLEVLFAEGRMHPRGIAVVEAAKADGSWTLLDDVEALVIPDDLAAALDENQTARSHFDGFRDREKMGILWWLKSAKRAETRAKRVRAVVDAAAEGRPAVS